MGNQNNEPQPADVEVPQKECEKQCAFFAWQGTRHRNEVFLCDGQSTSDVQISGAAGQNKDDLSFSCKVSENHCNVNLTVRNVTDLVPARCYDKGAVESSGSKVPEDVPLASFSQDIQKIIPLLDPAAQSSLKANDAARIALKNCAIEKWNLVINDGYQVKISGRRPACVEKNPVSPSLSGSSSDLSCLASGSGVVGAAVKADERSLIYVENSGHVSTSLQVACAPLQRLLKK